MKIIIDTDSQELIEERDGGVVTHDLYSDSAFDVLSQQWLKVGWNQKYTYTFSWLGRPIIQLPQDMVRIQEVIFQVRPDVIIETGIAHGGSLVFYASLCRLMGKGRVVGVDVDIRRHNRDALEAHPLSPLITLVEGDSVDPEVVNRVRASLKPGDTTFVILDSCHTREHVLRELDAYHDLVTPGSYIVVTDGIMQDLNDVPRGRYEWVQDNPRSAAISFLQTNPDFSSQTPEPQFNESSLSSEVTHWPGAWLRRADLSSMETTEKT